MGEVNYDAVDPEYLNAGNPARQPSALPAVLEQVMGADARKKLSANQRASLAWNEANGDRERRHTCGCALIKAKREGMAPRLLVYVDSPSQVTDLGTNKDIYLARLANWGLEVSGIDFRLSRTPKAQPSGGLKKRVGEEKKEPRALVPLSSEEQGQVEELVQDLPDSLRQRAHRAVELSMRRNKSLGADL